MIDIYVSICPVQSVLIALKLLCLESQYAYSVCLPLRLLITNSVVSYGPHVIASSTTFIWQL